MINMQLDKLYKKNEEVPCILKNYIYSTRTYEVETVSDHVVGYIRLVSHPQITCILRKAHEQQLIIPLRFKYVKDDKLIFWYKLDSTELGNATSEDDTSIVENVEELGDVHDEPDSVLESSTIEIPFSMSNTDYNTALLKSLVLALGEKIDSEEKYELAINIVTINKKFEIDKSLYKDLYNKATVKYQTKFWMDDVLPFCSNGMVKRAWNDADEDGRVVILKRLGININNSINALASSPVSGHSNNQNNANRTTQQVEDEAAAQAINERRSQQNILNTQRVNLKKRSESLMVKQAAIRREQNEHAARTAQRVSQTQNDEERQRIQNESHEEEVRIQQRLSDVVNQQTTLDNQIEDVSTRISAAQQEIETIQASATTATIGGRGKLKINLKWQTIDDVDLHVYDPSGNHIYYGDKTKECQGAVGKLDVDANAGSAYTTNPQENIFWDSKAPLGHYKVNVVLYTKRSGVSEIPFTVTIIPECGSPKMLTNKLLSQKQIINLIEFDYTEEGIKYN